MISNFILEKQDVHVVYFVIVIKQKVNFIIQVIITSTQANKLTNIQRVVKCSALKILYDLTSRALPTTVDLLPCLTC